MGDVTAKWLGLERLNEKILALPATVQTAMQTSNNSNALEFMRQVASIVPIGDDDRGEHLVGTLAKEPGKTPTAVRVSIGGPEAPYVAHVEFGHMTKDGKHVRAQPFWFPSLRVMRRRFKARSARAVNAAIKALRNVSS